MLALNSSETEQLAIVDFSEVTFLRDPSIIKLSTRSRQSDNEERVPELKLFLELTPTKQNSSVLLANRFQEIKKLF